MLAAICALAAATADPAPAQTSWTGAYDGSQMELAAALELGADGRFHYGLAYGALNEGAEGTWRLEGDRILLTSDPVTAPEFRLVEQSVAPTGELTVAIQPPEGLPVQLFDAHVLFASGERLDFGFGGGEESVPFGPDDPPVRVQVSLPMFDIQSQPLSIPALEQGEGHVLHFLFVANDLGKVAFDAAPLRIEEGALLLERHGRSIRFRRVEP